MLRAIRAVLRRIGELKATPGWLSVWRSDAGLISPDDIPEEERDRIIEAVAREIVKRGFTTPALLFIELSKPVNFIASQLLVALDPLVSSVLTSSDYRKFSLLMEDDENIERLLQAIERISAEGGRGDGRA
ncbi:hypothetical protein DRP77_00555 [Candidatus Poribacteria bacterium]|nr:MAG: hypothetical protein DRP77_00555 [Candidatus Poribacteria bacterium]